MKTRVKAVQSLVVLMTSLYLPIASFAQTVPGGPAIDRRSGRIGKVRRDRGVGHRHQDANRYHANRNHDVRNESEHKIHPLIQTDSGQRKTVCHS